VGPGTFVLLKKPIRPTERGLANMNTILILLPLCCCCRRCPCFNTCCAGAYKVTYNCSGDLSTEFKLKLKVTVKRTDGCQAHAEAESDPLTGNPDPTLTIDPSTPVAYCAGATSAIVKFNITTNGALPETIGATPTDSGVVCDLQGSSSLGTIGEGATSQSE
jgi:hypothetical protein